MIKQNDSPEPSNGTAPSKIEKKVYTKPKFRFERVFETTALACGKVQMGPVCAGVKKSS